MPPNAERVARIEPASNLLGVIELPPDKSIAHRSAILSAIAEGTSRIVNYPSSADPVSTLSVLRQLGVEIYEEDDVLVILGRGPRGFTKPSEPLDCGNSGTTMRLMAGLLAGQSFSSVLTGDRSLMSRPMERIADPLRKMGASVSLTNGHGPIHIEPTGKLNGINYRLPVASAQVKSCVLLAGLLAEGSTSVTEISPSRDHTERMLGLGTVVLGTERIITVSPENSVPASTRSVPRDFSAAAFLLVAGSIIPGSHIRLPRVGLNPTRAGLLNVLTAMGARIGIENERTVGGEPIADIQVRSSPLSAVSIDGKVIPNLIDELPVFAVAAAMASGRSVVKDAAELRHKETDRIDAIVGGLRSMGADVTGFEDGFSVAGGPLHGASLKSCGDHRIAMALAVAALAAEGSSTISDPDCVSVSYPDFWNVLDELAGR